mmetsp:Transcript_10360/g.27154  ORF Transcript_10360/g.27154 Transcript_10360/m.27154 type:complete len:226 (+) Transcript_10360:1725-2402(+)
MHASTSCMVPILRPSNARWILFCGGVLGLAVLLLFSAALTSATLPSFVAMPFVEFLFSPLLFPAFSFSPFSLRFFSFSFFSLSFDFDVTPPPPLDVVVVDEGVENNRRVAFDACFPFAFTAYTSASYSRPPTSSTSTCFIASKFGLVTFGPPPSSRLISFPFHTNLELEKGLLSSSFHLAIFVSLTFASACLYRTKYSRCLSYCPFFVTGCFHCSVADEGVRSHA